jgi:hypothetical protein
MYDIAIAADVNRKTGSAPLFPMMLLLCYYYFKIDAAATATIGSLATQCVSAQGCFALMVWWWVVGACEGGILVCYVWYIGT